VNALARAIGRGPRDSRSFTPGEMLGAEEVRCHRTLVRVTTTEALDILAIQIEAQGRLEGLGLYCNATTLDVGCVAVR
jgi:hypothetical protein